MHFINWPLRSSERLFSTCGAFVRKYCIQKIKSLCSICWIEHLIIQTSTAFPITKEGRHHERFNLENCHPTGQSGPCCRAHQRGCATDHRGTRQRCSHLITLQREDGASLLRPQIAIGKAWGAIALGKGSRLLALDAQQRPAFIAALNSLGQGSVVPAPGGVLIRNQEGVVLGAIGISGDTSDIDEQCAITAIEGVGLMADAGVSA